MEAVEGINQTIMTNTQCRLRRWRSAPKVRAPPPRAGGTLARRDSHRHPGVCIAPIRQPRLNGYRDTAIARSPNYCPRIASVLFPSANEPNTKLRSFPALEQGICGDCAVQGQPTRRERSCLICAFAFSELHSFGFALPQLLPLTRPEPGIPTRVVFPENLTAPSFSRRLQEAGLPAV